MGNRGWNQSDRGHTWEFVGKPGISSQRHVDGNEFVL